MLFSQSHMFEAEACSITFNHVLSNPPVPYVGTRLRCETEHFSSSVSGLQLLMSVAGSKIAPGISHSAQLTGEQEPLIYQCIWFAQVVTRSEGRVHTLSIRDVKLTEAGEVKLTAKDFQAQANLKVNGRLSFCVLCTEHTQILVKNSLLILFSSFYWNVTVCPLDHILVINQN